MSFNVRPFSPTYGTTKEFTVAATAGTSQLIGQLSGPTQFRLANFDTVKVAYVFGPKALADAITLSPNPKLLGNGGTEIVTVMPNSDGSPVYLNIISDAAPTGNKFEATQGQGI